jgi:hypothetical protein
LKAAGPADGLDNQIAHAQRHQVAVQPVTEGAGFVTAMHLLGQREPAFDPRQKLGRRELLRRLRRAVLQNAHHDDRVGLNVQAQLEGLNFAARDLIRANFGGIWFLFEHTVGWCSTFVPASQLLMSSPNFKMRHCCPANALYSPADTVHF